VRRGDTISKISARFGLTETSLVSMNGLRNRHQIAVGQRLTVSTNTSPGKPAATIGKKATSAAPKPVEQAAAKTNAPKAAQPITAAARPSAETPTEADAKAEAGSSIALASNARADNSLEVTSDFGLADAIEPTADPAATGSAEVANADVTGALVDDLASPVPSAASVVIPAPDPSDYAVSSDDRITVQANETLGHYADWLEIRTSRLRRLNGIRYGTPVGIGRLTKLDFSVVSRENFTQRRLEYHHTLQEEFFDAFEVVGTDTHQLKKGDTLWDLAEKRYRVPVWLLRQYNPTLDFSALQAGTPLTIPRIAPRSS
jgi:membrane-bound lytic murein transglycosylase D